MRLLLGTDEGIYLLKDRGALEAILPEVPVREIAQSQPGSPTLYLATQDRVYRSDDAGKTWRATAAAGGASGPFPGYEISSLAVHPWEPEVLLAGLERQRLPPGPRSSARRTAAVPGRR
jgi:hypothetical protein